jgi:dihydrofolate reductase
MAGGTTFIFVTDGIEAAFQQARQAAGDRDVLLAGGASVVQQHLAAGLVDEFEVHIVPATVAQPRRLSPYANDTRPKTASGCAGHRWWGGGEGADP